ncbi:hypothetical protein JI435_304800 [Parastagonospora nodorum SN15]|uniref:Uncharacterized protein n=1 Tax=Phaeosphaeria nodorum (strain SN15 / ATCC MYA-4574 / FGSC 10173) TaxID=321614 RepID=A0A7U2I4Q8_PHANO|nr:hypothetical protein JI435_304800 [Parastagonospora nodorum SN15]
MSTPSLLVVHIAHQTYLSTERPIPERQGARRLTLCIAFLLLLPRLPRSTRRLLVQDKRYTTGTNGIPCSREYDNVIAQKLSRLHHLGSVHINLRIYLRLSRCH